MLERSALPDDREDRQGPFQNPPTGPWGAPPRASAQAPAAPPPVAIIRRRRSGWSVLFALVFLSVCFRACQDISRPEAWTYWKESYFSPSMTSSVTRNSNLDSGGRSHAVLAIHGTIGTASAGWLRQQLDEARLSAGDLVLLSSPGGNLEQAMIMGEIIRLRGLATAVGTPDTSGRIARSFCASACVLVYAGGVRRYGVEGSVLGVHRFTNSMPGPDPIADAQRLTGQVLNYMTKMGVSSAVVEAMSATRNVRWLDPADALQMKLITDPVGDTTAVRR